MKNPVLRSIPGRLVARVEYRRAVLCGVALAVLLDAPTACAQARAATAARASRLALGFAVDTTVTPATWWGVDRAMAARPAVVRLWRDYLAVRGDSVRRAAFWSMADRRRMTDPDLALASEGYIVNVNAVLVEALPLVAGDSSRWVLRTVYVGGGTTTRPGLLAMERVHVVREGERWALTHPSTLETVGWRRAHVGRLEYVLHPDIHFDSARAAETARWLDSTALRFGIADPAPITYYQLPDLQAAARVMGLDWALTTDRVGGRANPRARVVFAADPRFGEAYRHEIAHVLLASWLGEPSAFVGEGIAYWLGGARGQPFPAMMRDLAAYLTTHPDVRLRSLLGKERLGAVASARLPAAAAVFELAQRRDGDAGVRHLVEATRRGTPSAETLAASLGLTPAELETRWRALVISYARTAER